MNSRDSLASIALTLFLLQPATAAGASYEETIERSFAAERGTLVDVMNLAGTVKVTAARGREVRMIARVVAGGDNDAEARELAGKLRLVAGPQGDRIRIHADYPTAEHDHYVYNDKRWGGSSSTRTTYKGDRVRVTSRGSGAELHVDLEIALPDGVGLRLENVVGEVDAEGIRGDHSISVTSGSIVTRDSQGRSDLDTASGSIEVLGHRGRLRADTGSGGVDVRGIIGDLDADTGSGSVSVIGARSDRIRVDTGSGSVEIDDSSGSLLVDTGSGRVTARNLIAGSELEVDTGSGSVRIEGDLSALRSVDIDTGSGGVHLSTTHLPSWELDLEVNSGGIRVDLPGMEVLRSERDMLRARVGDGEGRVRISTGSGGIRIVLDD